VLIDSLDQWGAGDNITRRGEAHKRGESGTSPCERGGIRGRSLKKHIHKNVRKADPRQKEKNNTSARKGGKREGDLLLSSLRKLFRGQKTPRFGQPFPSGGGLKSHPGHRGTLWGKRGRALLHLEKKKSRDSLYRHERYTEKELFRPPGRRRSKGKEQGGGTKFRPMSMRWGLLHNA